MVFDLYFPLFGILTVYLIVGAIASVAASVLLVRVLDRIEPLWGSLKARIASRARSRRQLVH